MSKAQSNAQILENQKGVITVEMLVLAPLLIAITAMVIYAANMSVTNMKNRKDVRNCIWQYAVNGCVGTPVCAIDGPDQANQTHIRQAIDSDLGKLRPDFSHLSDEFDQNVHGRSLSAENDVTTTEDSLGFSHSHNAFLTTLCNTQLRPGEDWAKYTQDTLDDHCQGNDSANPYCLP